MPARKYSTAAKTFAAKRAAMADRVAALALQEGLGDMSLRLVASRLGTSDRMLLYYFATKTDLVLAVLQRLGQRQLDVLQVAPTKSRSPPDVVLARAWKLVSNPAVLPLMRIWAEVSLRGAKGEEPYRQIAEQTVGGWLAWLETRLDMRPGKKRRELAATILTMLQGAILLEILHPGATDGVGKLLARAMRDANSALSA